MSDNATPAGGRELPTAASPTGWKFETLQVQAGQVPDSETGARSLPIYQTTSFVFPDAKTAAGRFALAELGPIYSRLTNPTQEAVENRLAALEGGAGALLVASGQAATTYSILNLAQAGDSIVASPSLYGGTYNLFARTLPKYGVEVVFVDDPDDPASWRAAIKPNTKALFGETIPNPKHDILDIAAISDVAHESNVPLIVDNTIATPYLLRPIEHGADVVVHSATKYLGGHGNAIGGVIVDSGRFDYIQAGKFPGFSEPDESYNGLVFGETLGPDGIFGVNLSYIFKIRTQLLRDTGSAISPFNSWLIAQGLETLSLRVERHVANAQKVAEWLEGRPGVATVLYAGLESSPYYEKAQKYVPNGVGGVLGFVLEGDATDPATGARGQAFVDALTLFSNVANIGDSHSLVIHPASTTHSQLSPEQQLESGVEPGFVRLSIGTEHVEDLLADLENAFASI